MALCGGQSLRELPTLRDYVATIGGPAASKVVHSGIYPIMKIEGSAGADILATLPRVMASAPPPWLASQPGAGQADSIGAAALMSGPERR